MAADLAETRKFCVQALRKAGKLCAVALIRGSELREKVQGEGWSENLYTKNVYVFFRVLNCLGGGVASYTCLCLHGWGVVRIVMRCFGLNSCGGWRARSHLFRVHWRAGEGMGRARGGELGGMAASGGLGSKGPGWGRQAGRAQPVHVNNSERVLR